MYIKLQNRISFVLIKDKIFRLWDKIIKKEKKNNKLICYSNVTLFKYYEQMSLELA